MQIHCGKATRFAQVDFNCYEISFARWTGFEKIDNIFWAPPKQGCYRTEKEQT